MTMWPLPENTYLGYKDFCKGCKHCKPDIVSQGLEYHFLTCEHMSACEALYSRITGGDKDATALS